MRESITKPDEPPSSAEGFRPRKTGFVFVHDVNRMAIFAVEAHQPELDVVEINNVFNHNTAFRRDGLSPKSGAKVEFFFEVSDSKF